MGIRCAVLALSLILSGVAFSAERSGWEVKVEVNPLYPGVRVFTFTLESSEGESASGQRVLLEIQVSRQNTMIYTHWQEALPGTSFDLEMKAGDRPPVRTGWSLQSNRMTAAFVGRNRMAVLMDLLESDTVSLATYMGAPKPLRAVFTVKGLARAAGPYMDELGW